MTRSEAEQALRCMAVGLSEVDEAAAAARFMERVSNHAEPEPLRSLLAEQGALAVLREARTR